LNDFYSQVSGKGESDPIESKFNILFPTEEQVEDSHLGVENAGSIICQAKFWDDTPGFPKDCFCL
jgi:hypothetical protein